MSRNRGPREPDLTDWQDLRPALVRDEEAVLRHKTSLLAQLRRRLGTTQEAVAEQMGVTQARVSAIEGNSVGATKVDTLSKYATALGGKLRIVIEVDGGEVTILG
jgi:DNA-binding XRE family transcriptional regulator